MSSPDTDLVDAACRFVVGIDLGTTNSAVAYVDTRAQPWQVRTFAIPQLVAPGTVEPRETLPSFHYQRAASEFPTGALRLPWQTDDPDGSVGTFARDHGTFVPGRLIASAKSWLCHAGVDRLADLLPWHGADDCERLSPVEASARYLKHLREAWDYQFPADPLAAQEVVVTLPASFDEVARELTIKAAARAGLPRVVLVEEPQAAFYAWINKVGAAWERAVAAGQKILVCDVGGGTSDFTLIRVRQAADGRVQFHRVAVGEHLILGGDNMDLALAHTVERRLAGERPLEPRAWAVLVQASRQVKESLLAAEAPPRATLTLPGTGSKLIGGARQVELERDDVRRQVVEGFFPRVALDEKPAARRSGFQEFGLPYAADAGITRYLAAFLSAHRHVALDEAPGGAPPHDPARPDIVLFNGGVFASTLLRERLLDVLGSWFTDPRGGEPWRPVVLDNDRLDLAVARGAAYYGLVRRGFGVRIAAGLARSYYVGVATDDGRPTACCLVPAGVDEGQTVDLESRTFELLIRQPVEFPLYVSSTRLTDPCGTLVPFDPEQMTALPPIRTVLQSGKKSAGAEHVTVGLHARLSEIGTLELWCGELTGPRHWKLQFDVRAATQTDVAGHEGAAERQGIVEQPLVEACRQLIAGTFAPPAGEPGGKPEDLLKRLAETTDAARHDWPPSLLRALWEALTDVEAGRRKSATHEARWLNLLGFALRPGYGLALDDWRVQQTWRLLQGKLAFPGPACRAEWWILWRRVAGGLPAGQQRALAEPLLADFRTTVRNRAKGRGADVRLGSHEAAEVWRLLGSLELLSLAWKNELGALAFELGLRDKTAAVRGASLWAIGRLGARVPFYGGLNTVVAADVAADWLERLLALRTEVDTAPLAVMQLARRTGDRYRDLSDRLRNDAAQWLRDRGASAHFIELVEHGGELAREEQGLIFGEGLPTGLRLVGGGA